MRCVGVGVCLQRCVCGVSCRPGGLKEELAVFRGRGEDIAHACAYLMYLLVGGGKRVLQGWAKAHAPEDPVDGVVPAGEGVLWSGRGSFYVSGPASTCVRVVGMAQIQGSAPADGQRRLIHWDRQSMASPRWYPARPEVLWARVRAGAWSPGWRSPLRTLCGVVGSPTAPEGVVPGVGMVLVPLMTHCGPGDAAADTT